ALEEIDRHKAHRAEQQKGDGVGLPIHLVGESYSTHAIDEAFYRTQHGREKGALAFVHIRHERAQGFGKCDEYDDIEHKLENADDVHSNSSGFNSANTR